MHFFIQNIDTMLGHDDFKAAVDELLSFYELQHICNHFCSKWELGNPNICLNPIQQGIVNELLKRSINE